MVARMGARHSTSPLPVRDFLIELAVVAVWGTNFVVIKIALDTIPPLFLATLRFAFVLVPAAFFIKRPAVPWRDLAAYGLLIGAGQFALLYMAMKGHISPGLASLVVQVQVAFTIGLSVLSNGERVRPFQWVAGAMAAAGILLIGLRGGGSATPFGLTLVTVAALCWAGGNMVAKRSPRANMLAYVVWASLFAVPPLLALSLTVEGYAAIAQGVTHAKAPVWAAVLWQSVGNTMFGYGLWGWLLARHPAATVTPMALLVPIFGMSASALLLAEAMPAWKLSAAGLVMGGLALNLLWPALSARIIRRPLSQ
ncbi:MAG TPA: EamA family transporter [Alphaproteobacteria bacterium]|nr:EamA family transporter [Alphaproteobacteria bacterium]